MFDTVDAVTGLVVRKPPAPIPFGPTTIAEVLERWVAERSAQIALIDGDRSWTYRRLDRTVQQAAIALYESGLRPGDRLLWSSENCAELVVAFLAVQRIGAVWAAVDPRAPHTELEALVDRIEPVSLLDSPSLAPVGLAELMDTRRAEEPPHLERPDPHRPAAIASTSGTGGRPKSVVHSQHSMLVPCAASIEYDPPSESERLGTPLALTVLNALLLAPISAFVRGSTAVIMRPGSAAEIRAQIVDDRVTRTFLVPTIAHDLVSDDEIPHGPIGSLESVVVGGAGTSVEIRRRFLDRHGIRPQLSYGLTEAPTGIVRESLDEHLGKSRSYPLPHVSVRAIDGELCAEPVADGPWTGVWTGTLGYWRDAAATRHLFRSGLLHTGDSGTVEPDGAVSVTGRLSETIVRGGANIDPGEVEAALMSLDGVHAAAVVGVADDRLGQRVGAAIVDSGGDPAGIASRLREIIAGHKIPDSIVHVEELPRNAMGKVDRMAVKRLLGDDSDG